MIDPEVSLSQLIEDGRAALSQLETVDGLLKGATQQVSDRLGSVVAALKQALDTAIDEGDSRKITYMVYEVQPDNHCPGVFTPGLEVQGQSELARGLGVTPMAVHLSRKNALLKWEGLKDAVKWPEDRGKFTVRGVTLMELNDYYRALSSGLKAVHGLE